ncbi:MAG TPA: hypothetical protein P5307_04910 [Pirellulaceae bacterium]|nr:hypothetical protein [Pirellulaceae bacterium]
MKTLRKFIKGVCWLIGAALVLPIAAIVLLLAPLTRDASFLSASQFLSLFPGAFGNCLRQAFYWMMCRAPWPGPIILFGTTIAQRDSSFGERVYVGSGCNLGRCHIGGATMLGSGVHVASRRAHEFEEASVPISQQGGEINKVTIGANCWVGNAAVILADLEDGVVVGAGSVVTKPCSKNGVYVGNPARLIRTR